MNAFLTKTLLAGLSAAAIGGSAGYAYYHQTPKTIGELIQWEGNRLISKNNAENTYKAIIEEQTKEILKKY